MNIKRNEWIRQLAMIGVAGAILFPALQAGDPGFNQPGARGNTGPARRSVRRSPADLPEQPSRNRNSCPKCLSWTDRRTLAVCEPAILLKTNFMRTNQTTMRTQYLCLILSSLAAFAAEQTPPPATPAAPPAAPVKRSAADLEKLVAIFRRPCFLAGKRLWRREQRSQGQ